MSHGFGSNQFAQVMNGSDGLGGVVSTGTPVVSKVIPCNGLPLVTVCLFATLNLSCSWLIEESLDWSNAPDGPESAGRWSDVRLSNDPAIPNAPGGGVAYSQTVRLAPAARRAIRVTATRVSGSGVPEVWANATRM